MVDGDSLSALGEFLSLLGEFFDLLGFFDDGHGKGGTRVCLIDLVLELGYHFIESCHVRPDFLLILPIDGFLVGAGCLWAVEAGGKIGIGSVWRWTRLRRRAHARALKRCYQRLTGQDTCCAEASRH